VQVGWWLQRARKFSNILTIESFVVYESQWLLWWKGLQPAWRREGTAGLPAAVYDPSHEWVCIRRSGPNGIVMVLIAFTWWGGGGVNADWTRALTDLVKTLQVMADIA
jgi:hypothetical protein